MYLLPISWQQSPSGHCKPSPLDHYCSLPTGPPGPTLLLPSSTHQPHLQTEKSSYTWCKHPFPSLRSSTPSLCPWNKILTLHHNLEFPTLLRDPPSTASLRRNLPWLSWAPATGAFCFLQSWPAQDIQKTLLSQPSPGKAISHHSLLSLNAFLTTIFKANLSSSPSSAYSLIGSLHVWKIYNLLFFLCLSYIPSFLPSLFFYLSILTKDHIRVNILYFCFTDNPELSTVVDAG